MSFQENFFNILKELVQTALISLLVFFLVYIFLVQPHRVKGESMLPNFKDGELLLTEKVTYRLYSPERGDVIVFEAPSARRVDFIKRIIGLPGDSVKVINGFVFVNGEKLIEPYETQITEGNFEITLDKDQYFVLGDNRGASSDSRSFGPISKKTIKGKAWVIYWPIFEGKNSNGLRMVRSVNYGVSNSP